jgi:hypothetical protein
LAQNFDSFGERSLFEIVISGREGQALANCQIKVSSIIGRQILSS